MWSHGIIPFSIDFVEKNVNKYAEQIKLVCNDIVQKNSYTIVGKGIKYILKLKLLQNKIFLGTY